MLFGTFKAVLPRHQVRDALADVWIIGMAVYILCAWLMICFNLRMLGVRKLAAVDTAAHPAPRKRTPYYTYLVPIVPVFMIWCSNGRSSRRSC